MRIYILEDHPMVIQGIRTVLEKAILGVEIIEETDLEKAFQSLEHIKYDLAIIDINISGRRAFGFLKLATQKNKKSKHLVFTSSIRKDYFEKAFECDIDGYLVKECMPEDLVYAIHSVMKGHIFIDPIYNDLQIKHKDPTKIDDLTEREKDVLRLIGEGMSNQQIADTLFIAESTVKKHVSRVISKMGFHNRTEAALYCQHHYV